MQWRCTLTAYVYSVKGEEDEGREKCYIPFRCFSLGGYTSWSVALIIEPLTLFTTVADSDSVTVRRLMSAQHPYVRNSSSKILSN